MSVKQLIIDMSMEARAEFRKLLDELDAVEKATSVPAPKAPKKAVEEKIEDVVEAPADAEAPIEDKSAS
jgi:hypothetical protein